MALRKQFAWAVLAAAACWQSDAFAQATGGQTKRPAGARQVVRNSAIAAQHSAPVVEKMAPAVEPIADADSDSPLFDSPDYDGALDGGCDDCSHGDCGMGGCVVTSPPSVWVRAEYLLWSTKSMHVPALATTSPAGTAQANAGVLGQTGTSVLFGNDGINDGVRSGGRFAAGFWFDICHRNGLEVTYLGLEDASDSYHATSSALGILARPFFDVQTGTQDARLIGFPAVASGFLVIDTSTQFQTGEVLYRHAACIAPTSRVDLYLGWRYGDLNDTVRISDSSLALTGTPTGSTVAITDQFHTTNIFNGADVGVMWQHQPCSPCSPWSWEVLAKVALGNNCARSNIAGQTTTTPATGAATTTSSGLLALGTNRGVFDENKFSSIGELGLTVRRRLKCGFTATLGYRFMYWTDVARAGQQIDTGINPSQIPPGTLTGPARPSPAMHFTDFWAQGLHAGLECAF